MWGLRRGLETRLVPEAGFPLELIRVGQLKNVSIVTKLRTVADLPLGVVRCVELVRGFKPDVVVGVGGYASGPAMMAAILLRVPTLAFEPNAVPGLANKLVGAVCVGCCGELRGDSEVLSWGEGDGYSGAAGVL